MGRWVQLCLMEAVSTDVSATVSGPSFLSPSLGDHDYESIDSELPEEVRLPKNVFQSTLETNMARVVGSNWILKTSVHKIIVDGCMILIPILCVANDEIWMYDTKDDNTLGGC